jgi:type II secretory ATPase GspE/PulE/Tfp pilus assembly ATPase PilB-like protein
MAAMKLAEAPEAFFRSSGCHCCHHSGFSSRKFLTDVLVFDHEFLQVFEQSRDAAAIENYLKRAGYHGLEEEGLRLLMAGEVSPEEYIASVVL